MSPTVSEQIRHSDLELCVGSKNRKDSVHLGLNFSLDHIFPPHFLRLSCFSPQFLSLPCLVFLTFSVSPFFLLTFCDSLVFSFFPSYLHFLWITHLSLLFQNSVSVNCLLIPNNFLYNCQASGLPPIEDLIGCVVSHLLCNLHMIELWVSSFTRQDQDTARQADVVNRIFSFPK